MSKCARPGCDKAGIHKCSICLRELYCSSDCQKGDWKSHKLICNRLKKLSHQLQPFAEVTQVIQDMMEERGKRIDLETRIIKHLISYAGHQFGDRVLGKDYRERYNGERIENWNAEIVILIPIYYRLISMYEGDESLSTIGSDNLRFPYLEKMLELLRPWSVNLDKDSTGRIDNPNKDQIERLLTLLSEAELRITFIHKRKNQFDEAEDHCQRAISLARQFEGKEERKTDLLCDSLIGYSSVLTQRKDADAVVFAAEAYDIVAIAYNPVHPKVQEAAFMLIECLIHTGDLYNALRFAEATLDSLKDPGNGLDQESEEVANGYHKLAKVINQQKGDFEKAEMLIRESLRIRSRLYCHDNNFIGSNAGLLADILKSQGNLGHETKELYERFLTITTK